eukprot:513525-Rhodomonas_salina.2
MLVLVIAYARLGIVYEHAQLCIRVRVGERKGTHWLPLRWTGGRALGAPCIMSVTDIASQVHRHLAHAPYTTAGGWAMPASGSAQPAWRKTRGCTRQPHDGCTRCCEERAAAISVPRTADNGQPHAMPVDNG